MQSLPLRITQALALLSLLILNSPRHSLRAEIIAGPVPPHPSPLPMGEGATFAASTEHAGVAYPRVSSATSASSANTSLIADAAEKSDLSAIRTLLKRQADVNAPQADGMTALHWAVYHGDIEAAKML